MNTNVNIPLTKEGIEIVKQSQHALSAALKGKFGCTPVIHNVDVPTTSSFGTVNTTAMGEIKYSKQLAKGLKISVWKHDLTVHKVDAVVNAANEELHHGGGLALALSNAGGPEIQRLSKEIIKVKGRVRTGEAVCTPAGNLPCKRIIHAVGPQVSRNASKRDIENASPLLKKAIWKILQMTEYENLQSVAIPAISSGLYNFPRDVCADIIVTTVKSFSNSRSSPGRNLEVRLVNNDDPSVQEMQRACLHILGQPDYMGQGDKSMPSQTKAPTRFENPCLDLGNLTLFIKKGAIEEETADVIVNTVGNDLSLSVGQISNAILKKAGNKIQDEIKKKCYRPASCGEIIPTDSYNLKCKAVFHTVCAEKGRHINAHKILHTVVMGCLTMASKQGFSSISFPAIGTGNLNFKNEEVSKIMISAVHEFAWTYSGQKMDVYFVIFSRDGHAFKVFEQEMALHKKTLNATIVSSATGKSSSFDGSGDPFIELCASSPETLREAQAWATGMLHRTLLSATVKNNLIIHFGQQDHADLMSLQTIYNVKITEFFTKGRCGISIEGDDPTAVISAVLEVEAMLCRAQDDFAKTEEEDLLHSVVRWEGFRDWDEPGISAALEKAYLAGADTVSVNGSTFKVDFNLARAKNEQGQYAQLRRMCIFSLYSNMPKLTSQSYYELICRHQPQDSAESERWGKFLKCGLNIVKMEKIENYALKQVFELNSKRVSGKPQWLYQRVTAQFCDQICRVGFQREYAPPEEQLYGAGIYFTTEVKQALQLWEDSREEYVYIIEAQVLTGKSVKGSAELIVPPPTGTDPLVCYDSVTSDLKNIYVIFHAQQTLPQFLITCTRG